MKLSELKAGDVFYFANNSNRLCVVVAKDTGRLAYVGRWSKIADVCNPLKNEAPFGDKKTVVYNAEEMTSRATDDITIVSSIDVIELKQYPYYQVKAQ